MNRGNSAEKRSQKKRQVTMDLSAPVPGLRPRPGPLRLPPRRTRQLSAPRHSTTANRPAAGRLTSVSLWGTQTAETVREAGARMQANACS